MKVALAQYDFTVGDFAWNLKKILHVMAEAKTHQCELLVFPEMALSGYIPEDLLLREDFLQTAENTLAMLTQHVTDCAVIVGCPLRKNGKIFNAAVVLQHQKQVRSEERRVGK